MKFTKMGSKSKRPAKFFDVKLGQVFFWSGNAYMATEEIVSETEDVYINAICLSGANIGTAHWIKVDEDVSILFITPEILYTDDDVITWI